MFRTMLKSKIHRATITHANLHYDGSLTIDRDLMDAVDLLEAERVHIYNLNNGERFETYAIEGPRGSGVIGLNGAAARKGLVGDCIIIVSYAMFNNSEIEEYKPRIAVLDEENRIKRYSPI